MSHSIDGRQPVIGGYDRLLASIGDRAADIGDRPVVTHWPHVGSAYRGLVIVGQAVYGWADDAKAVDLQDPVARAAMIASIQSRVDKPEPLDWIDTHPVRTSPFWRAVRRFVEALEPDIDAPWYARFAWVNLYPSAPEDPPGNPGGALKEAEDPHVGPLLRAVTDWLDANRVIATVGPFWWPAAGPAGLADLPENRARYFAPAEQMVEHGSSAGIPTGRATAASAPPPTPRSSSTPSRRPKPRDRRPRGAARMGDRFDPEAWARAIGPAASADRLVPIADFVADERDAGTVLPSGDHVFAAFMRLGSSPSGR